MDIDEGVSNNPIANPGQLAAESQVLRLWARSDVQDARRQVGSLFALAYGVEAPAPARPRFEAAMDEYACNYLFKAAASDGEHPRLVRDFMAPYAWFGRDVPGSRMGGDNPDNCYRLVGIEHAGRYHLSASPSEAEPASTSFTLVANYGTSKTVQTLEASEVIRNPDRSFEITIDADPSNGRPNHLRSSAGTKFLFIRESFGDWARETPYALSLHRIDPSGAPPIDDDEAARRAIEAMIDEIPLYYWFTRLNTGKPVNTLASPTPSGLLGGLVTQAGAQGWFSLEDDEAMIVRADPAGARYCALALLEWWYRSIDAAHTFSSLTSQQAETDGEGLISFVVSRHDAGVRNWVETGGLNPVLVIMRWQGLPAIQVRDGARVLEARRVPLSAVRRELGAGVTPIDPQARELLRRARMTAYERRISV